MNPLLAFFEGAFAPSHIIVVLIVGVLLFGKRLPEVGRSLGKGLMEFKRGMHGLENELKGTMSFDQQQMPFDRQQAAQVPQMIQAPQRVVPPAQIAGNSNNSVPPSNA